MFVYMFSYIYAQQIFQTNQQIIMSFHFEYFPVAFFCGKQYLPSYSAWSTFSNISSEQIPKIQFRENLNEESIIGKELPNEHKNKYLKVVGSSQEKIRATDNKNKKMSLPKSNINSNVSKIITDEDFKHRTQTPQRNLPSNTLKLYLKQLRDTQTQTHHQINVIIESKFMEFTVQEFLEELDKIIPRNKHYVGFQTIKQLCSSDYRNPKLAQVLRISIYRFFKYQIFCIPTKSVRTTRKIRNQQVRQGKMFLHQLFNC